MSKMEREILAGAEMSGMMNARLVQAGKHLNLIGTVNGAEITIVNVPCTSPRDSAACRRTARDTVRRAVARGLTRACWGC